MKNQLKKNIKKTKLLRAINVLDGNTVAKKIRLTGMTLVDGYKYLKEMTEEGMIKKEVNPFNNRTSYKILPKARYKLQHGY